MTRSEEDNLNFQKCFNLLQPKLNAKEVFVSVPLLKIFFEDIEKLSIPESSLIFTSRYGIKAISELEYLKLKKIYCVGKATAEIAIKKGFKEVFFTEEGNVNGLIDLISKDANKFQTFHYMRGKNISFDLKKALSDLGYKVKETIIYKQYLTKISETQKNLIRNGKISGIIFFSASVAKLFCEDLKKVSDGFLFYCISDRVSDMILKSDIRGKYIVKVSKQPNLESIIDLICKEENFYK